MRSSPAFLSFFFVLLLLSCSENGVTEQSEEQRVRDSLERCKKETSLNPNGDSQLTLLMREMTAFTDSLKSKIASNRPIGKYPKHFESMLIARPTDSTLNRPVYTGFAKHYLEQMKALYYTKEGNTVQLYNNAVNSCITCHENFCQGPIKRIQKMLLPESAKK